MIIFCSSSKAEILINESDIDDVFKLIENTIITSIPKLLEKCSGCIIYTVLDHTIIIYKYHPLAESSYIKLPKELDHPRKGLFNIQNTDDNECFKWCLLRYLNHVDHHPARIIKVDKGFTKRLDFQDIKFPVKARDIYQSEKNNYIGISIFGYENKVKYPI